MSCVVIYKSQWSKKFCVLELKETDRMPTRSELWKVYETDWGQMLDRRKLHNPRASERYYWKKSCELRNWIESVTWRTNISNLLPMGHPNVPDHVYDILRSTIYLAYMGRWNHGKTTERCWWVNIAWIFECLKSDISLLIFCWRFSIHQRRMLE